MAMTPEFMFQVGAPQCPGSDVATLPAALAAAAIEIVAGCGSAPTACLPAPACLPNQTKLAVCPAPASACSDPALPRPCPCLASKQDWTAFGEFCAEIVEQVDSGELGEQDAEKLLRCTVMYQVGVQRRHASWPRRACMPACLHAWLPASVTQEAAREGYATCKQCWPAQLERPALPATALRHCLPAAGGPGCPAAAPQAGTHPAAAAARQAARGGAGGGQRQVAPGGGECRPASVWCCIILSNLS
jgi:hypothetical protein